MKKIILISTMLLALSFVGCKEDNWMDWKAQNELWLQQNASQEGIHITSTGLQYKVLYQGNHTDAKIGPNSIVTVKYTGKLINGKRFDASDNAQLGVSEVVAGFGEGLKKMNVKGHYILYIPWELGYGEDGTEASETSTAFIPPYSTLIFDVEVKSAYTN